MGRVREKKRWKKEEKMERWWKKKRSAPPFDSVLHPSLTLATVQ